MIKDGWTRIGWSFVLAVSAVAIGCLGLIDPTILAVWILVGIASGVLSIFASIGFLIGLVLVIKGEIESYRLEPKFETETSKKFKRN